MLTWDIPTAVDNADPSVRVACIPEPGSEFAVGVTDVVCEATDKNKNTAVCIFSVNVTGILLAHMRHGWGRADVAGSNIIIRNIKCMR